MRLIRFTCRAVYWATEATLPWSSSQLGNLSCGLWVTTIKTARRWHQPSYNHVEATIGRMHLICVIPWRHFCNWHGNGCLNWLDYWRRLAVGSKTSIGLLLNCIDQIPLRYPGRRPGFLPGFRHVPVGLRPARDIFGSKACRKQVLSISTCRHSCDLLSTQKKLPAGRRTARTCRKPGRKSGLRPG